jgi:hypothetical protein
MNGSSSFFRGIMNGCNYELSITNYESRSYEFNYEWVNYQL